MYNTSARRSAILVLTCFFLLQFFLTCDILMSMENKYLMVLSTFIQKEKRERIVFELKSTKKRETAFSKMSNFSECFNEKSISIDLSHLEVESAIKIIKNSVISTNCFDLVYNEVCSISKAYERAVSSCMFNALIIDEQTIVYIGEVEFGASEKYILKRV